MNKVVQKNRINPNIFNHFSSYSKKENNLFQVNYIQFDSFQRLINNKSPISYKQDKIIKKNLAFIRLLNVLPKKISLDIYINRTKFISNLTFKESSHYLTLPSGEHLVEIFKTNDQKPIHSEQISLLAEQNYTMAIGHKLDQISLFSYMDNHSLHKEEAKIRFINLSPNSPNLDFAVKAGEGDVVFPNVPYAKASEYLPISPMTVNLEIRLTGTKTIIFPLYKSKFEENIVYDLISVGCVEENPKFEVIILF
ncbi:DUF4397 domain-containing protein [Gottfriedia acidiceleris]|uniref:DUF4397 domain-containing protein n=1 Tax=Gottfriedia acidiceleris TaxID=371036 RepID=A0ABY4JQI2_9BACI|nr:DUF4397 domain-containing protein [Gottfriedia acidiceleris]UPM56083.1 DUF4397 domain-containing protein [Gottfriedia acidiceleris]